MPVYCTVVGPTVSGGYNNFKTFTQFHMYCFCVTDTDLYNSDGEEAVFSCLGE